ncbi:MAG: hypothetical protein AAGG75_07495 [Bacteroidota bacterium]
MKKIIFFSLLSLSLFFVACDNDDEATPMTTDLGYHAHIMSPSADNKHVGDTIHIHVNFESHAGEVVHNVQVRIYNKDNDTEIFNGPDEGHVHETSGKYSFHKDFVLSEANGVTGHSNWVLEAKVWGHHASEGEAMETVEFHVHP